ncbi:hypothetical protein P154DRAFT_183924 [Amniculicola lignicola CBS 123094]|uniref:Uncharacterized protein n=1 Tax=Amniculicola lignicola CBS 123094 TaxID=1392246 RepID=A0A6A5X133_9PLEO|nr:hypothetical protein P154DRAFT_183924 [Amniculicola lignicola CBS 123094]
MAMAPDLNSVSPASPRTRSTQQGASGAPAAHASSRHSSTPGSRRASQIFPMSPPPLPLASPGGSMPSSAQSNHSYPPLSPGMGGAPPPGVFDASGVPMRHPRPLTAAELHLELEKEQEAVVNRLTRELSALRAHSASVASTASSASNALLEGSDAHTGALLGPTHPRMIRGEGDTSRGRRGAPAQNGGAENGATGDASTAQ